MKQRNFEMKTVGKGGLVVAVTACIHGNEHVGLYVHEWLLENRKNLEGEVRLIFGNPEAYLNSRRFMEKNLNRAFPGSLDGNYEQRQAYRIMQEIQGADLHIDFHSTTNPVDSFAICIAGKDDTDLVRATGLENVMVYAAPDSGKGYAGKTLNQVMECPSIAVECGQHNKQSTIRTGISIMRNVLMHYGIMKGEAKYADQDFFLLTGPLVETQKDMEIPKGIKEFQEVLPGSVVGKGKDGTLHATESFYPILVDRDTRIREDGVLMLMSQKVEYAHGKVLGKLK